MRSLTLLVLLCTGLPAADMRPDWTVLYGHEEFRKADTMLQDYLNKARSAVEANREKLIAGISTPAALRKYQAETAARLRAILGEFPARTALNPKIAGRLERSGYTVEKLIFESRPRYYVTANVYVPGGRAGRFPGVICPVGHWGAGKYYEDMQRLGAYLARRGFVVLVYDSAGQGERQQYWDPVMARTILSPGTTTWFVTTEHGYAGGQTILARDNYAAYLVWDGIRALDYLSERRDVDPEKLACTGTSGGGLQTELLSAIDPRIKVSIPVCYGGCAPDTPARHGLGMMDVDALIAPRPLLMVEATGDPRAAVTGKQKRHELIAKLYAVSDATDRTQFAIFDEPHGYGDSIRRGAYRWLSRWLRGTEPTASDLREEPIVLEPDAALACTTTGQVKTSLGGETVYSLNRAEAAMIRDRESLPASREALRAWRSRLHAEVESRITLNRTESALQPRTLDRVDRGSYILEKVVYHSEPEVYVPAVLLLPKTGSAISAVVFANESGKTAPGVVDNYLRPLVESGVAVLAIDTRGTGETTPAGNTENSYRNFTGDHESRLMYDSLAMGATPLGMRTRDVLRGVDYLRSRSDIDAKRISVIGQGSAGLPVLHAVALDDTIRGAAITNTLATYGAIVDHEIYTHRYVMFTPGALRKYDLPDVAALVAPRPLLVINAVDEAQRPLDAERAAEVFASTAKIFDMAGAPAGLRVLRAVTASDTLEQYRALVTMPAPGTSKFGTKGR
jgi:dienelactone hydrolase